MIFSKNNAYVLGTLALEKFGFFRGSLIIFHDSLSLEDIL